LYPHLRIVAPAAPGGGWDLTARAMQQALQTAGIVTTSSVENVPGAAGTIGLARLASAERGNGDVIMVSGLIMLAAVVTHHSQVTLQAVTPIARLTGEFEVIVVPAGSPFRTLHDLMAAFKARPESISWGGGSAGGTDQILAGLVADAVGVAPRRVNYIAYSGGGESLSAILGGQVSVGINGLSELAPQIEAGSVRALAISSAERLPSLNVPTLREQGVDVELENWRSLVAPPGISAEDRTRLESAMRAMTQSAAWRDVLTRYRWNDRYLAGEAFARFSDSEEARVQAILNQLGVDTEATGAVGPYPWLVLTGFVVTALIFAVGAWRSGRAAAEPPGVGWKALAVIAAGIGLDLLLLERAGFVIASSVLFWLTARAFDASRPARDAMFAVGLAVGAYLLFVNALDLTLPPGVLAGLL
jgi:putative tricarboxylic transport membrane protein